MRFPHYIAMWDVIDKHFVHEIPAELWLNDAPLDVQKYKEGLRLLNSVRNNLELEVVDRWQKLLDAKTTDAHFDQYPKSF